MSPVFKAETVGLSDAATLGWNTSIVSSTPSSKISFSASSKIILLTPPPVVADSNAIPPFSYIRSPLSWLPCIFSSCNE